MALNVLILYAFLVIGAVYCEDCLPTILDLIVKELNIFFNIGSAIVNFNTSNDINAPLDVI